DWGFASELEDVSGAVAIVGIGDADYSKATGRTTHQIAAQATERALADAGLRASDIDGLMYVPFSDDQFDAAAFHTHFGTSHDLWVSQKGGGMVWPGSAPYDAALAIRAGRATYVLNTFAVAWAPQRPQMVGGPTARSLPPQLPRTLLRRSRLPAFLMNDRNMRRRQESSFLPRLRARNSTAPVMRCCRSLRHRDGARPPANSRAAGSLNIAAVRSSAA